MGRFLGKYELLRPIRKGGMAEVHLARVAGGIEGAHKLVVVKQMLPWLADDASFVQMFVDEARLALALDHPNLVHASDVGNADGRYFLAMEYLHGEDVAHLLAAARDQGHSVGLGEALTIAIGVASGLHYAHEKRGPDGSPLAIVHRDVSPQNVFVTFDGGVKLLDFGIAKAAHRQTETRHGTIKGKVRYMPPEQIRAEPLDRRADVYALGVVLWELTTGRPAFEAANDYEAQRMIIDVGARRPSAVVSDYPPELEAIVMTALARRREERFESAETLQLALEAFARERKLTVSSVALARKVRELFAPRAEAFLTAQAAGIGAVTQHVLADLASRPQPQDDAPPSAPLRATRPLPPPEAVPAVPQRRARRIVGVTAVATAIAILGLLAGARVLAPPATPTMVRPAAAVPAELPQPAELPVRVEPKPVPAVAAPSRPPPPHAAASRHKRPRPPAVPAGRWDAEAALPPP